MPDYKQGKIYKLCSDVDAEIYVGSTCNSLAKRKYQHQRKSKECPQYKVYKHINLIGWEHVEIILIENYPCNDKNELRARERYYKDLLNASLNTHSPFVFEKEKKAKQKANKKAYYASTKIDALKEMKKYRESHKEQRKAYLNIHKEYITPRERKYYLEHKAQKRMSQTIYLQKKKLQKTDDEYKKVIREWNDIKSQGKKIYIS